MSKHILIHSLASITSFLFAYIFMPVNIIAQEQNDKAGLWEVRRDTNTLRLK